MFKIKIFLLFLLSFVIFSCHVKEKLVLTEVPEKGQVIHPKGGEKNETQSSTIVSIDRGNEKENLVPNIPIGANGKVIKLLDTNLDGDSEDEQIIIVEIVDKDNSSTLELWISNFDSAANKYTLAWKGEVSSITSQSLSLSTNESAEQGLYEIYVMGYNSNNEHVLDVFYPLSGNTPQYKKIFSQTIKGTIELNYPETEGASLSDDYGTRVRISPNIIITQADPHSSNSLDTLITTWKLYTSPLRYKVLSTRNIIVSREQEEKLVKLINGSVDEFENALSDYWYREEGDSESIRMININNIDREVQFLTMDNFENYQWTSSHKSSYAPRLYIYSSSQYISTVRKELTLNVVDMNTLTVSVFDNGNQHMNNNWSGNYNRMTEEMKQSLIVSFTREFNSGDFDLNGKFKSATGEEFIFDNNQFALEDTDRNTTKGYFTLFKLNDIQLLELVYYDDRGIKLKKEVYQFDYSVVDDRDHRIRSFNIIPGSVDVRGFTSSEEREKRYEQIEIRESE